MLKTRNVLTALVVLVLGLWAFTSFGSSGENKSGRTNPPPKRPAAKYLTGDLNYSLVWKPTAAEGGPSMARLSGALDTTTNLNPFWYAFTAPSGTALRVKAVALIGKGQQPGWLECWFYDHRGNLLDHAGPTDAINGCSVKGVVP